MIQNQRMEVLLTAAGSSPATSCRSASSSLQRHSCVSRSFICLRYNWRKYCSCTSCCEPRDHPLTSTTLLFHKVFRTHLRLNREKHLFYHFSLSFSDWQKVPLFSICKTLRKSRDHKANQIRNESRKKSSFRASDKQQMVSSIDTA